MFAWVTSKPFISNLLITKQTFTLTRSEYYQQRKPNQKLNALYHIIYREILQKSQGSKATLSFICPMFQCLK